MFLCDVFVIVFNTVHDNDMKNSIKCNHRRVSYNGLFLQMSFQSNMH